MKVVGSNSRFLLRVCGSKPAYLLSFIMSPNSRMGDELKFPQQWEFRRKDEGFYSSSNDSQSNSISESTLKEHNMVSGWISLNNDETSNTSRPQPNLNNDYGFVGQFHLEKAEEKNIKSKKNSFASSELKKDSEELNRKKSKTSAYGLAAVSDVKSFTESLLEELRASREKLFTWMREEMNKLIADDTGPSKRRKGSSSGKKVQSWHQNKSEKNISMQSQKNVEKNLKFQDKNITEECIQDKQLNGNGIFIHMQQQNNFGDTDVERQNKFDPNCNGKSLESFVKSSKAHVNDHCQALDDQVDYSKGTESIMSVDKEKKKRLALASNSKFQPSSSDQSVTVQHPKSVVLAIQAQNCNDGSSKRSAAGKKKADSNKLCQVPEDRPGYSRSMASCEKDKAKRLKLRVGHNFTLNSPHHAASSMYLTLPTVLTKAPELNRKLDTSLCNFIQPRDEGNKTTVNLERPNQMVDFSSHCGYFPSIQEEQRGGNFAQIGSRNIGPFDQNSIGSSSSGIGFPVPLHQGMGGVFSSPPGQFYFETVPRESGNTLGLRMNGGATTFSGGNDALSDHLVADNIHSHPNYKADLRFLPYQIHSARDGYLFPK